MEDQAIQNPFLLFFSPFPFFLSFFLSFLLPPFFLSSPLMVCECAPALAHRLNHLATSSHRGCAIEPDGNTATHPEREGKELDTGDVVPKMASPTMLV